MANGQRAAIPIGDLGKLMEQENKPQTLTPDEVHDYAVASLLVLRGLPRGQKLRVLQRMRKLLG